MNTTTLLQRTAGRMAAVLGAAALAAGGCARSGAPSRPLLADAFVQNKPPASLGNPVDKPGVLLYDTVNVPLFPREDKAPATPGQIGPVVRDAVRSPVAEAKRPSTQEARDLAPLTQPALVTLPQTAEPADAANLTGQYLNLGAVLMEVNDQAIFTDKVLADLEVPLATEAKKRPAEQFKQLAKALLENQINLYKREELEFAAAQRTLGPQDDLLAKALTTQWRQKRITEAGGSIELAKRKSVAEGYDFDELVKRQYRVHIIQIFYQKHVIPLIQVPASKIREYFIAHKDDEFTTHGGAKFRLIKIDSRKGFFGGRDEATAKALEIRKQAADGADFADLAAKTNDDMYKQSGGYVVPGGWVDEGAFAVPEVNKALADMRPGQVSDVISVNGVFYIVKMEDVRRGGVQSFEDLAVQDKIREKLRAQQFQALREKHVAELERNAVTKRNDAMVGEALGMIMRRYSSWASAK